MTGSQHDTLEQAREKIEFARDTSDDGERAAACDEVLGLLARLSRENAEKDEALATAINERDARRERKVLCEQLEDRVAALETAIKQARRDLWWFVERETGNGWGFEESDTAEICARAMAIQDDVLAAALVGEPAAEPRPMGFGLAEGAHLAEPEVPLEARERAAALQERLGFSVSAGSDNGVGAYAIVDFDSLDALAGELPEGRA